MEPYNDDDRHLIAIDDDIIRDALTDLVGIKKKFFDLMNETRQKVSLSGVDYVHHYICIEQALDDMLDSDARSLDKSLGGNGNNSLPMSPLQAQWLKEQYQHKMRPNMDRGNL